MRLTHLAAALTAGAVVVATPAYARPADSEPRGHTMDLNAQHAPPSQPSAKALLARAKHRLTGTAPVSRLDAHAADGDMTLLLRDLAARQAELPPAEQELVEQLLARPDAGATPLGIKYRTRSTRHCYRHVCMHWVTSGDDRPSLRDGGDRDRLPDWVETSGRVAENVWRRQVTRGGYRAPRSDLRSANHGPNGKLDIYLANLGDNGLFGFCTSDDPRRLRFRAVSAYCVIDDDFSRREYFRQPIKSLQVTLAHEFFHAVQFGYDWREDVWLLEGTAMWMEDQLYDDINDSRRYLRSNSPLTAPEIPLDGYFIGDNGTVNAGNARYGAWAFFQYLSERHPVRAGGLPKVIRDVWRYADDASPRKPRQWSTKAVNSALLDRSSNFRDAFARFSAVNLFPRSFYSEGAHWPVAPTRLTCTLTVSSPCAIQPVAIDHMSSSSAKLQPGPSVTSLQISVDLPDLARGSAATLTLVPRVGKPTPIPIPLDSAGEGVLPPQPFSAVSHLYATVTLTNGSSRFNCGKGTFLSCRGMPLDDNQHATFTASAG